MFLTIYKYRSTKPGPKLKVQWATDPAWNRVLLNLPALFGPTPNIRDSHSLEWGLIDPHDLKASDLRGTNSS